MKSNRIWGIDYARSFAIVLALVSHFLISMQEHGVLDVIPNTVRLLTRSATPMFVFMFGFMIVFAYQKVSFNVIKKRMWTRSMQCYIAYCLTAFSGYIGGYKILLVFLASLLMFAQSHFGNILKVYAIILIFTPWLMLIYRRYDLFGLAALLVFFCLWGIIKNFIPDFDVGNFSNFVNLIFGVFGGSGPSVTGALIFVIVGMVTAHFIIFFGKLSIFYLLCLLSLLLIFTVIFHPFDTPFHILMKYIDYSYRGRNSIEYYIFGSFSAVLIFSIFILLDPILPKNKFFVILGVSSLISYTFGNIILNLSAFVSVYIGPFYYLFLFSISLYLFVLYWRVIPISSYIERLLSFDWFLLFVMRIRSFVARS
jgi:hypothetical protein